ncbi:hypothetical protein HCU40_22785 (plasmid) [Pseudanabaena biceps]|nr:hypothetical protein [Pseudanabaena biceps]
MNIRKELLDELLQECKTPPDLFGEGGILKQLTTALVERALEAELSTHLGYKKHESRPEGQSNSRNGYSQKTVQGDFGIAEIAIPRDRQGEFEPQMVKKGQSRLSGLDEKIISLYARGMSVRDTQAQLQEMYAGWFHFRKGLSCKEYRKEQELGEEAKTVKNGLVEAKQKAKPDHELYRTIKADPRPSKK